MVEGPACFLVALACCLVVHAYPLEEAPFHAYFPCPAYYHASWVEVPSYSLAWVPEDPSCFHEAQAPSCPDASYLPVVALVLVVAVPSYQLEVHQNLGAFLLGEVLACLWGQAACQEDPGDPCSCERLDDVAVHACLDPSCPEEGDPGAWEVLVDPSGLEV